MIIFIAAFLLLEYYNISQGQKRLPKNEAFQLAVTCEEGLKPGDTGELFVSLENNGDWDYYLNYTDLFVVYMDGKRISPQDDGTYGQNLPSGDEVTESYEFIAGEPGKHPVEVSALFQLENDAGDVKEYRYQKKTMVQVAK